MEIGDIRIREMRQQDGRLRAVASITIDGCFVVHDIKILEKDGELFIAMPSRKTSEGGFKDIAHPINSETRDMIRDMILAAYRERLAQSQTE